jgi:hypothetical protein
MDRVHVTFLYDIGVWRRATNPIVSHTLSFAPIVWQILTSSTLARCGRLVASLGSVGVNDLN